MEAIDPDSKAIKIEAGDDHPARAREEAPWKSALAWSVVVAWSIKVDDYARVVVAELGVDDPLAEVGPLFARRFSSGSDPDLPGGDLHCGGST